MNDKNSPIFRFDKNQVKSFLNYDKNYHRKLKGALKYIFEKMEELGHFQLLESLENISISDIKEKEGKNYNWSVVQYENLKFLIRRYGNHFTVFVNKHDTERKYNKNEIGAFTFYTDIDNIVLDSEDEYAIDGVRDEYYYNPFMDFNKYLKSMIEVIQERGVYWFWNNACLPREKHIEIKVAFEGKEHIISFDELFYCYEEIDNFHTVLFAENDMFQKLEEVKERIGEFLEHDKEIIAVYTNLKDEYYHAVGIKTKDKKGNERFQDVYSLTQFYYDKVFIPAPLKQNDFGVDIVNNYRYINAVVENELTQSFILPKFKDIGIDNIAELSKDFKLISIPTDEKETKQILFEVCKIDRDERIVQIIFHSIV